MHTRQPEAFDATERDEFTHECFGLVLARMTTKDLQSQPHFGEPIANFPHLTTATGTEDAYRLVTRGHRVHELLGHVRSRSFRRHRSTDQSGPNPHRRAS